VSVFGVGIIMENTILTVESRLSLLVSTKRGEQMKISNEELLFQVSTVTRREYFAAMAMQALLSSMTVQRDEMRGYIIETAVKYADDLNNALEEKHEVGVE